MHTTFQINANELNVQFVEAVKTLFNGRNISLTIEIGDEMDETRYLLSTEANRKMLMKRLKDVQDGKNLESVNLKDL